ncbi:hypothetical protein [Nocardia sp. NPDC050710]|uniref:hypothetical protein n=1 Tax=Nocardia sp. NPDC050710 TaxID=3157220 RepID=UPI0034086F92
MTNPQPIDFYDADPDEPEAEPDWKNRIYEVFNADRTVGVACNRDGEVIGLHLDDEARENGDSWLASEIVKLARLAHLKSRVGLREEMEYNGSRPYVVDSFDLPTENSYRSMERAELGTTS